MKIDRYFGQLLRPKLQAAGKAISSYKMFGVIGFWAALVLSEGLAPVLNLSPTMIAGNALCAYLTYYIMTRAAWVFFGRDGLTFYHYKLAVLCSVSFFINLLHQPILPYLDVTILGVGIFHFCGRIGCFMVGCCHGKPHRWGVCYTEEHRKAGFTPYLVGVSLFPVQLLESLFILLVVIVGTAMVMSKSYMPGIALSWYIILYGAGRFHFEFLRGDPDRPYFAGFSEAQWTSLILMSLVTLGEFAGKLPFHSWHAGAAILMVVVMVALSVKRKFNKAETFNILLARHIQEIAGAVDAAATCTYTQPHISVGYTSLGYRISAGRIETPAGRIHHYAFSKEHGTISQQSAQALAELTLKLKHPGSRGEFVKGNEGVFHLLVPHEERSRGWTS
jgi:hypothetical protein